MTIGQLQLLRDASCAGVLVAMTVQAANTHCQSELQMLQPLMLKAMLLLAKHTIWLVDFADGRHVTLD